MKSSNIVHMKQKWPENNFNIFKLHNWGTKHNVKFHYLISNSEGLGMCLYIMGLATIEDASGKTS